jgi:hypothetical protein
MEPGDIQCPAVEQLAVGGGVVRIVLATADELADVFVLRVVTHVDDWRVVGSQRDHRTVVTEAAERGALDRLGGRIEWIDLDDPAEPVRLVRIGAGMSTMGL